MDCTGTGQIQKLDDRVNGNVQKCLLSRIVLQDGGELMDHPLADLPARSVAGIPGEISERPELTTRCCKMIRMTIF
ncbi:MAG: hypothetical protein MZV63_58405 [Marinilabiliales bacterium]|nr:hypothetical protein [Marinilabiliales bacterium]